MFLMMLARSSAVDRPLPWSAVVNQPSLNDCFMNYKNNQLSKRFTIMNNDEFS